MAQDVLQAISDGITQLQFDLLVTRIVAALDSLKPQPESLLVRAGIPFGASLGGAMVAFLLNWVKESRKEQNRKNDAINEVMILFSENITTLLNYKLQFLSHFTDELRKLGAHASQYGVRLPPEETAKLVAEWNSVHKPNVALLMNLHQLDPVKMGLNGLLKRRWEIPTFAEVKVEQLNFTIGKMPNILRFALNAVDRLRNFSRTLKEREGLWDNAEPVFSGDHLFAPNAIFMRHLYELINVREALTSYADSALVLMRATTICLADYQERTFPKRKRPLKWLMGTYRHVRHELSPEAKAAMPKHVGIYGKEWFGPHYDLIRDKW